MEVCERGDPMGTVIAEFFSVIGPDVELPTNMIELIPYLLTVFFGVLAVCLVFKLVIELARVIVNHGRF